MPMPTHNWKLNFIITRYNNSNVCPYMHNYYCYKFFFDVYHHPFHIILNIPDLEFNLDTDTEKYSRLSWKYRYEECSSRFGEGQPARCISRESMKKKMKESGRCTIRSASLSRIMKWSPRTERHWGTRMPPGRDHAYARDRLTLTRSFHSRGSGMQRACT